MRNLADEGLVTYDSTFDWVWDIQRITGAVSTSNVLDTMVGKLSELPQNIRNALAVASCIGPGFDLETVAVVSGESIDGAYEALYRAWADGYLLHYNHGFRFSHDKIMEAAASLLTENEKEYTHLRIGEALLAKMGRSDGNDNLFDIVNHLKLARRLITEREKIVELAELNVKAGQKGKLAAAYDDALNYLNLAKELLADRGWEEDYPLTFKAHITRFECECAHGDFEKGERTFEQLISKARTVDEKVEAYLVWIPGLCRKDSQVTRAFAAGQKALALLDIDLPLEKSAVETAMVVEVEQLNEYIGEHGAEMLKKLPVIEKGDAFNAMRILMVIVAPARDYNPELFMLCLSKIINLSIRYGRSGALPFALASYGAVVLPLSGRPVNLKMLTVSTELIEIHPKPSPVLYHKTKFMNTAFGHHWFEHIGNSISLLHDVHGSLHSVGAHDFAAFALGQLAGEKVVRDGDLADTVEEFSRYIEYLTRFNFPVGIFFISMLKNVCADLQGNINDKYSLSDNSFDEFEFRDVCLRHNMSLGLAYYYMGLSLNMPDFAKSINIVLFPGCRLIYGR